MQNKKIAVFRLVWSDQKKMDIVQIRSIWICLTVVDIFSHLFDSSSLAMRFFYFVFVVNISKCRALFLTVIFFFSHFFASYLCCVIIYLLTEWEITVTLGFLSPPIVYIYYFRKVERNLRISISLFYYRYVLYDVVVLLLSVFFFSVCLISTPHRQGTSIDFFVDFATQSAERKEISTEKTNWLFRKKAVSLDSHRYSLFSPEFVHSFFLLVEIFFFSCQFQIGIHSFAVEKYDCIYFTWTVITEEKKHSLIFFLCANASRQHAQNLESYHI